MITSDHITEMKQRLKIYHQFEDDHIENLLEQSYEDLNKRCGGFEMEDSITGRELVYERTRYAYNDSLEFFYDNFLGHITSFSLNNTLKEDEGDGNL